MNIKMSPQSFHPKHVIGNFLVCFHLFIWSYNIKTNKTKLFGWLSYCKSLYYMAMQLHLDQCIGDL